MRPLRLRDAAALYAQFYRGTAAGLPNNTLASLLEGGELAQRARVFRRDLARGVGLAQAGQHAGLFTPWDAELIRMAEQGGVTEAVFEQLSQRDQDRYQRQSMLRSRMALPVLVLILALAIAPLPALVGGQLSAGAYLWAVCSPLIGLALLLRFVLALPAMARSQPVTRAAYDRAEFFAPYFGAWNQRRAISGYCRNLGLMHKAGVPILQAVHRSADPVRNSILRSAVQQMGLQLKAGAPMSQALQALKPMGALGKELISIGDAAGKLDEMLLHFAALQDRDLALHDQLVAEWLPRVFYAGVMLFMIQSLI